MYARLGCSSVRGCVGKRRMEAGVPELSLKDYPEHKTALESFAVDSSIETLSDVCPFGLLMV